MPIRPAHLQLRRRLQPIRCKFTTADRAIRVKVVVFGDTTTNRLASSVDSTFFRIFNTAVPPPGTVQGTTRKIWKNTVTVGTTLPAGTYWLDWASTVTGAAAHFQPSKTIAGARGAAGDNARQLVTGAWADVIDVGNPATAPDVPQDFPFDVDGIPTGPTPTAGPPTPTPTAGPPTPTAEPNSDLRPANTDPGVLTGDRRVRRHHDIAWRGLGADQPQHDDRDNGMVPGK